MLEFPILKLVTHKMPTISKVLETLVDPVTKGDPESSLRWTSKSLRNLTQELKNNEFDVSHVTVASLLRESDYSLQLNRKEREGKSVPDRNAHFERISEQVKTFHREGQPVISVDTKKKNSWGITKMEGVNIEKKAIH